MWSKSLQLVGRRARRSSLYTSRRYFASEQLDVAIIGGGPGGNDS